MWKIKHDKSCQVVILLKLTLFIKINKIFQNKEFTCNGAMLQLITVQFKHIPVLNHTGLTAAVYNIVC